MKLRTYVLTAGLCLLTSLAFAADVLWQSETFSGTPLSNRLVYITPIANYGVAGSRIISGDRQRYTNDATGSLIVSNVTVARSYRVEFIGPYVTTIITNSFPANVTGYVNAADFVAGQVSDGNFTAYSQATADARFHKTSAGSSTNATFRGTVRIPEGATVGYVFTVTNADGSGAWRPAASGVDAGLTNQWQADAAAAAQNATNKLKADMAAGTVAVAGAAVTGTVPAATLASGLDGTGLASIDSRRANALRSGTNVFAGDGGSLTNLPGSENVLLGMAFGSSPSKSDNSNGEAFLAISSDGTNWNMLSENSVFPTNLMPNYTRNHALFEQGGNLYATGPYLTPGTWIGPAWVLFKAGQNIVEPWTLVASNYITGLEVGSMTNYLSCTSPPWVDENGGVHVITSLYFAPANNIDVLTNGAIKFVYQYATDTNGLTTWSAPQILHGSWETNTYSVMDGWTTRMDGTNYLWYVQRNLHSPTWAFSTAINGTYITPRGETNWNLFPSFEAISLNRFKGKWRIYGDDYTTGPAKVSTSTGGFGGDWSYPEFIKSDAGFDLRSISVIQPTNTWFKQAVDLALSKKKAWSFFATKPGVQGFLNGQATAVQYTNTVSDKPFHYYGGTYWTNREAGWYHVEASVVPIGKTNNGQFSFGLGRLVTGNPVGVVYALTTVYGPMANVPIKVSTNIFLRSGDILCPAIYQATGQTVNAGTTNVMDNYFSIVPLNSYSAVQNGTMSTAYYDTNYNGFIDLAEGMALQSNLPPANPSFPGEVRSWNSNGYGVYLLWSGTGRTWLGTNKVFP